MNEDSLRRTQKQLLTCLTQLDNLVNDHVLAASEQIVFRFGEILGWTRFSPAFSSIGWDVHTINMLKKCSEAIYVSSSFFIYT